MLLLIFLLEAMAGVLAYVYQVQLQMELSHHMNVTFANNYNRKPEYTAAIDQMQQEVGGNRGRRRASGISRWDVRGWV